MGYLMLIFGYKFAKCKKSINRLNLNYLCCAIVFLSYHLHNVDAAYRPHIIFIMADDLVSLQLCGSFKNQIHLGLYLYPMNGSAGLVKY